VRARRAKGSVKRSECTWIGLNEFGIDTVGLSSRRCNGITTLGKAVCDARRRASRMKLARRDATRVAREGAHPRDLPDLPVVIVAEKTHHHGWLSSLQSAFFFFLFVPSNCDSLRIAYRSWRRSSSYVYMTRADISFNNIFKSHATRRILNILANRICKSHIMREHI